MKTSRPISPLLLGLAGTLAVVGAHLVKLDRPTELDLLDLRLRQAARSAGPTNILHVDIDDRSLTELGRWPWPREQVAHIVQVLQDCGARAVVLDIFMPEPQKVRYVSAAGEIYGHGDAAGQEVRPVPVFDDAILAQTIAAKPNVFLPMVIDFLPEKPALQAQLEEILVSQPTLPAGELAGRLGRTEQQIRPLLTRARKEAADRRVGRMLAAKPTAGLEAVLADVLGGLPGDKAPVLRDAAEAAYLRHRAIRSLRRFGMPGDRLGGLPIRPGRMDPPLVTFAEATSLSGFVTFEPDPDGVVRRIPLLGRSGQRVYPQFAFAVAARELARRHGGLRPLAADASRIRLVCAGGQRREIPVDDEGFMLIGWARPARAGERASGRPHGPPAGMVHIPALAVANIWREQDKLRRHEGQAHAMRIRFLSMAIPAEGTSTEKLYLELGKLTDQADEARSAWIAEQRRVQRALLYQPADVPDRRRLRQLKDAEDRADRQARGIAEKLVAELRKPASLDAFLGKPAPPATKPAGSGKPGPSQQFRQAMDQFRRARQQALQTLDALDSLPAQRRPLEESLARMMAEMRTLVAGKICMVGSTATGAADFVPTPLGPRTPGVVVHSNILNTVLTGNFVRPSSLIVDILVILAAGALVSFLASEAPVLQSAAMVAILAAEYAAFNVLVAFAGVKFWLAVVAPVAAMIVSFLVITVYRQLTEERAKRQIRDLFAHALSPALVDRLLEDPSLLELGGQKRAVSCIFADIAGFTAMSEGLGPQETVRLLNQYFDRITEVIQNRRGGYLNKFLGDGVFCFFGAPVFQDDHPARAIQAAVDCQAEVTHLNETLNRELGLPTPLSVRIGVTTGEAMVGNCGSTERLDYTAIGDCVNLASRLEAANKTFGTQILVAEEAWRLGGRDDLLARPLGGVSISGFREPVRVWQILGPVKEDTPAEHRKALDDFARAIELFDKREFPPALELFQAVREVLPDDQPTLIYVELCRQRLRGAPDQDLRPQYKKPDETLRIVPQQKPPPADGPPA